MVLLFKLRSVGKSWSVPAQQNCVMFAESLQQSLERSTAYNTAKSGLLF